MALGEEVNLLSSFCKILQTTIMDLKVDLIESEISEANDSVI